MILMHIKRNVYKSLCITALIEASTRQELVKPIKVLWNKVVLSNNDHESAVKSSFSPGARNIFLWPVTLNNAPCMVALFLVIYTLSM
jgi:hypothetical protein